MVDDDIVGDVFEPPIPIPSMSLFPPLPKEDNDDELKFPELFPVIVVVVDDDPTADVVDVVVIDGDDE